MGELIFFIILIAVAVIGVFLFWGTVIYIIVRIFRSDTGLTGAQKVGLAAGLLQLFSRRGSGSTDLMDTEAGNMAAGAGIDLNDRQY
jgi:hypothetical protein